MTRGLRIAVVAAPPALLALHRIDAADVWLQLATGRWIVQTGGLPARDPFGSPPAATWVVHDWLASLVLWAAHSLAGAPGLVLLSTVLTTAALVVPLVVTARDRLSPVGPEMAVLVATLVAYERFFVRPEVFTFLALVLWIQALARGAPRSGRAMAALLLLQAAWANLHAAFVLGPPLAALAVVGDWIDARRRTGRWQRPPLVRTLLPVAALAACCLNPYGPRLLVHVLRAGGQSAALRRGIAEWQPTFAAPVASDITLLGFVASLLFVAICAVRGARRARAFELLAVAALAVLACTSRRHLALWAFGALPLAAAWYPRAAAAAARAPAAPPTHWLLRTAQRRRAFAARLAPALVLALAAVFAADVARGSFYRRFGPPRTLGWGVSDADHPIGAAAFVVRHGLEGPLFNNVAAGSYLVWSVAPHLPVWVDGRLLDAERFRVYRQSLESPAAFDALAAQREFRLVVLALQPHAPVRLVRHLYASPVWRLTYLDGEGAVFVHAAAAASPPALRLESELAASDAPVGPAASWGRECDPGSALRRGRVLLELGFAAAARADLTRALVHCPRRDDVALALGRVLLRSGDAPAAAALLERAVRADPNDPDAWFDLGACRAALGDVAAAHECWQRALRLQPGHRGATAALGARR